MAVMILQGENRSRARCTLDRSMPIRLRVTQGAGYVKRCTVIRAATSFPESWGLHHGGPAWRWRCWRRPSSRAR